MKPTSNGRDFSVDYPAKGQRLDGVFTTLLMRLDGEFPFDRTSLKTLPTGKKLTLWFRHGAKRVFHISIVRKGARYVIEMSGGDPGRVLSAISICKDHFDTWFGVTAEDIRATEGGSQRSEVGGRGTEVRGQRSEVGGQRV